MNELQETLYEEYKAGKFESIQYLQNRRQEIREVTGLVVPRRPAEAEAWFSNQKSNLSRQLNPENSDDDESEQDEGGGDSEEEEEGGDNEN